jgi:O-antigen/teichoic acid export membrane protein
MTKHFWIKRMAVSLIAGVFVLLLVQLVKGAELQDAVVFAALWGVVFAATFTGIGYLRFKRNPACMVEPERAPRP